MTESVAEVYLEIFYSSTWQKQLQLISNEAQDTPSPEAQFSYHIPVLGCQRSLVIDLKSKYDTARSHDGS